MNIMTMTINKVTNPIVAKRHRQVDEDVFFVAILAAAWALLGEVLAGK
jgi:hypothetical protein